MQSKGVIKLLAILLAIACIYQLSFSLKARSVEKKAAEYAAKVSESDSLRQAGIGGVSITRSYILPQKKFRIGSGTAVLDSVGVNTGIDLHTGQLDKAAFSNGQEDGFLGLNLLKKFSKVIINLKDMYLETIPYTDK